MFNLTRQERIIILFLTGLSLIGMGFNFLSKRYAKIKSVICVNENIAKIDINQADERALMDIPGIGEKISRRIIDQRTEQSGFSDIEELKKIKGMTHYRYKKLKEYFYVK